jgi:hypothetical protein
MRNATGCSSLPLFDMRNVMGARLPRRGLETAVAVVILATTVLIPTAGVAAGANGSLRAGSCGTWSIVYSPREASMDTLSGISALSPRDVWAVGRYVDTQNEALIEHWTGWRWRLVPAAGLGSASSYLDAVAAVSPTDVWAVGGSSLGSLIEHWDGARWSMVESPSPGVLSGIDVVSSTDIWAVGSSEGSTLTEHWDGTRWSVVGSPNPGAFGNSLAAVTAISPNDAWAVGESGTSQFGYQVLVLHWVGSTWRVTKTPPLDPWVSSLRAVSAGGRDDVWAVGVKDLGSESLTVAEHWDGRRWRIVPSPSPTGDDVLLGAATLSRNDAWTVGDYSPGGQNLIEHWDGTDWSVVSSAFRKHAVSTLAAISVDPAGEGWAAGTYINKHHFSYTD